MRLLLIIFPKQKCSSKKPLPGKYVDCKIVKVKEKKVKNILSYGEFLSIEQVVRKYNLDKFLLNKLGEKELKVVLAVCISRLFKGLTLQNISIGYEGTRMHYLSGDLPLSSASIIRSLSFIGGGGHRTNCFHI